LSNFFLFISHTRNLKVCIRFALARYKFRTLYLIFGLIKCILCKIFSVSFDAPLSFSCIRLLLNKSSYSGQIFDDKNSILLAIAKWWTRHPFYIYTTRCLVVFIASPSCFIFKLLDKNSNIFLPPYSSVLPINMLVLKMTAYRALLTKR
jgi:hypothetical protein